jgi:hypothetical protein
VGFSKAYGFQCFSGFRYINAMAFLKTCPPSELFTWALGSVSRCSVVNLTEDKPY